MPDFLSDFAEDTQFVRLLTRHDEIDLARCALELARDGQPGLDFVPTLEWIAARGAELRGPLARARSDEALLEELAACLAGRHGLVGSAEVYDAPESSYLNCVIERRTGLPITLSLVYMLVATEAGITLQGVGAPRHFLTRYDTLDAPLFVDAFAGGTVLTYTQCLGRVREASGLSAARAHAALGPVDARTIIKRMLNNLKTLFARNEDWPACWKVQHRLLALDPASFHERRDWALVSLRTDRCPAAIDMLENCLHSAPPDERAALEQHLADARNRHARWN